MRSLVISLHDVAPATLDETRRWRERVAALTGGPVSLLVVPRYHGGRSWRPGPALGWLRRRAEEGDEVVLHGYVHLTTRGTDRGELRGRPRADICARVSEGHHELRAAGLEARGFIAPAYVHPRAADVACAAAGLTWWATRLTLRAPARRRALPCVSLGASTGLRRLLSPATARAAARALAAAPAVRLDLHPSDLRHPELAAAGRDLIERLLDQGRRAVTHEALAPAGPASRGRPAAPVRR